MSSIVKTLEEKLLGRFGGLADFLKTVFPNVQAVVYSHESGSQTEYQGHSLGVDCLIEDAAADHSDSVALSVNLAYLTTRPRINADVCWGHPNARTEADFFSDWESSTDWPEVSDEVLERLYADIPRLSDALVEAVSRRRPSEK